MRQYIVSMTDNFIGKYKLDVMAARFSRAEFIKAVTFDLEIAEVNSMRPETLGRILCAFELGDVLVSKEELSEGSFFAGSCENMLRSMVALTLAHAIWNRLQPNRLDTVPGYPATVEKQAVM